MTRSIPRLLAGLFLVALALPATADYGGVTLYEDENFRGRYQSFDGDVPSLVGTDIGNDRATSLRLDRGCEVTLYSDANYRGRSETFQYDVDDLGRARIGNDSVSSLRVQCRRHNDYGDRPTYGDDRRPAVTLYTGPDYRGDYEVFYRDDPGLYNNDIGNDRVRSVQVGPGCKAVLFEHPDYGGRSITLDGNNRDLKNTRFGRAGVSSLRVDCRSSNYPTPPPPSTYPGTRPGNQARGVTLYRDEDFRGRYETFYGDRADLGRSSVGNDSVSSVRVSPGCRAVLYRDDDFRGEATEITRDVTSLKGTAVGNDGASSLVVDCRGRRRP